MFLQIKRLKCIYIFYEDKDWNAESLNAISEPLFMRYGTVNETITKKPEEITSLIKGLVKNDCLDVGYIDGALMLPENAIPVTVRIPATSPNKVYAQEHTSTSVKVVWQNINCANEYYVRMTDEEGNKKVIKTTEPSLPLKNLKEGGKYTFEVSVQVKRPKSDGSFTYETMPYGAATQITMPTAINIPIKSTSDL